MTAWPLPLAARGMISSRTTTVSARWRHLGAGHNRYARKGPGNVSSGFLCLLSLPRQRKKVPPRTGATPAPRGANEEPPAETNKSQPRGANKKPPARTKTKDQPPRKPNQRDNLNSPFFSPHRAARQKRT